MQKVSDQISKLQKDKLKAQSDGDMTKVTEIQQKILDIAKYGLDISRNVLKQ